MTDIRSNAAEIAKAFRTINEAQFGNEAPACAFDALEAKIVELIASGAYDRVARAYFGDKNIVEIASVMNNPNAGYGKIMDIAAPAFAAAEAAMA